MDTTTTELGAQRRHESPELGAAAARMIRALYVRAGEKDTEALEQLAALEQLLPVATSLAGYQLHASGYSHSELGAVLGISRQASVKRFGSGCFVAWNVNAFEWMHKRISSGAVMRELVSQLAARRAS